MTEGWNGSGLTNLIYQKNPTNVYVSILIYLPPHTHVYIYIYIYNKMNKIDKTVSNLYYC